jgi:hypothetical protein
MKRLIGATLALALILAGTPVLADTASNIGQAPATFHALSQLPVEQQAALTPLPDDQLGAIVGGTRIDIDIIVDAATGEVVDYSVTWSCTATRFEGISCD